MYISYSGYKKRKKCKRAYWHGYIGKTKIDPPNKVHSLFGFTTGVLFEQFYEEKLWSRPDTEQEMKKRVVPVLESVMEKELRNGVIDWKDKVFKRTYKDRAALETAILDTIPRGLAIIKHHRLLGPESRAEVSLDCVVQGHKLGGRADFIIRRIAPHSDLLILDGKGSKHRERYVDNEQLLWYALLHRIRFGVVPDKVGFLFWKFEPEEALEWVSFKEQDLDNLLQDVLEAVNEIQSSSNIEDFPVNLSDECKLCDYNKICVEGDRFLNPKLRLPVYNGFENVFDISMDDL